MHRIVLSLMLVAFPMWRATAITPPTVNEQVAAVLQEIKKHASLKLSPTSVQNAIDAADFEALKISSVTLAASIDQAAANALIADQLPKDGQFKNPRFEFAGQSVDGTVDYAGSLSIPVVGTIGMTAQLHTRLAVASETVSTAGPATEFRIGFAVSALEVTSLKFSTNSASPPNFVNDAANVVINSLLVPAQTLLDHVVLNLPTPAAAKINLKASQQPGLIITYNPQTLSAPLQILSVTHLANGGRLTVVAQEGGSLKNVPSKPTNVPFVNFVNDFQKMVTAANADWIKDGDLSAYVDRVFLQQLVSRVLGAGPVCLEAKLRDLPAPFSTKLTLPPVDSIDCTPTTDCTPKIDCTPKGDCSQNQDCSACALRNLGGGCVKRWNDPTCEARKVAAKGTCEANKSLQKGQCEAQKSETKAKCEATKTAEKASCESLKASYKAVRATGADYANVDSKDLRLTGGGSVCISHISFDPASLKLTGTLAVTAVARADGHINFTPLNVTGHFSCFAPVQEPVDITAVVPAQSVDINTSAKFVDDATQVSIDAYFSNPIHLRFPFAIVAANLASDPKFTIFCPVPNAAMRLRASTPDSWWPAKARGNIDHDLPDFRFDLDLVQKPIKAGGVLIKGKLRSNKMGIGGEFTLAKPTT
jgi:hypothetical protein